MLMLSAWQQTTQFEPDNPGQMIQEHYTGLPGGYSSFYFNRVPTGVTAMTGLNGALAASQGTKTGIVLGVLLGLAGIVYLMKR